MRFYSIIVTYNPDFENLIRLIEQLNKNRSGVIIVDNNSTNEISFDIFKDSILICLEDNFGIAKAQNIGIKKAIEMGADQIIFFDQDSQINTDFIQNLISDYENLEKNGQKIAAIGPQFIDKELGFYAPGLIVKDNGLIKKVDIGKIKEPKKVGLIISSGSLVPVTVLEDVGLMNEDFFIDYVDTEWCFRALNKGYSIYVSNSAVMYHSVGESTIRFLGKTCPVHSSYRRYYRVRNLFLMLRMRYISRLWVCSLLLNNIIVQVILFVTQKNKFSYFKYFIRSILDGIRGKTGAL